MKQEEIRQRLIDGTIRVIAREGLDKATTKHIASETSVNEVYIYRCFENKEALFAKTFAALDEELVSVSLKHASIMYETDIKYDQRCWIFFNGVWRFLLGNKDKCLTFIRYFYSQYFSRLSSSDHKLRFEALVEKCSAAFREEANVWMILNHIFNVMLDFAVKVYDGDLADNDDTAEHVFRLVYISVRQYFKKTDV